MSYREITDINTRLMNAEAEVKALRAELDEIYMIIAVIGFNDFMHNRYFKGKLDNADG